jgi:hypothetical protein
VRTESQLYWHIAFPVKEQEQLSQQGLFYSLTYTLEKKQGKMLFYLPPPTPADMPSPRENVLVRREDKGMYSLLENINI